MLYNKIISYIYALLGVGYGTYILIFYCINYIQLLYNYSPKTVGIIKSLECNGKNKCYGEIEYEVNNIKYINNTKISKKLKIGDKIELRYNKNNHRDSLIYEYEYIYLYIILLIIGIIILWILLIIVIIYDNKYIYLLYAIFFTTIITYTVYININSVFNVNNHQESTKGIIKSQEECNNIDNGKMCYSIIEYTIKGKKYNIKTITYNYKVGEEIKVYYDKAYPEAINVYDKIENKKIIEISIIIIFIILLWIFLLFNIPIILK